MELTRDQKSFETIVLEVENGTALLKFNRPNSLNAFNGKMTEEIQSGLRSLDKDDAVRCVGITGIGRAFSAGQDLKELTSKTSFGESLKRRYNPIIRLIAEMQKPVVALINGVAAGAGMSLALACDFRTMSSEAKLIQAFAKIGLVPDSGSTYFLPEFLGRSKAFEFATLGEEIPAREALELGLVNRVFEEEHFVGESWKILDRFAKGPTRTYSLIKRSLRRARSLDLSLEYESYLQEIAGNTEDAKEGMNAFKEKRNPVFKGR